MAFVQFPKQNLCNELDKWTGMVYYVCATD